MLNQKIWFLILQTTDGTSVDYFYIKTSFHTIMFAGEKEREKNGT